MRDVTIEGKVLVFKSLAISKIAHLSLTTTVPHAIIIQLNNPKIKHSTLTNSFEDGCLKDVNVFSVPG